MHPYYEKNQARLKKELEHWLKPVGPELEQRTGCRFSDLLEQIWECYRSQMLERFPYIGGDKSSGTRNLTGAYSFVAMGVVCRQYGLSLEEWGQLTTTAYQRFFEQFPAVVRRLAGSLIRRPALVRKMLQKKDAKNAANAAENPGSFVTRVQPPTEEYPVIYHMTVCPLADFARRYGYMEYMPYLCNLDYAMFAALNVPFYREKTCAAGDGFCDFKLRPGAPVVPAWPCHGLDPDDPLK